MILKRDCTGWIKWLEWDNNLEISWMDWEWKHKSSEISSALQNKWIARCERLRGAPIWKSIWHEERNIINNESLNWIHGRGIREWRLMNLKLVSIFTRDHRIRTLIEKSLRIAPDNSKSQVRSWEKTCGLGPTQKKMPLEMILKRDCTGWIKWLEWDNNLQIAWTDWEWKHKSCEISSAL